jgi:hypothetical protein
MKARKNKKNIITIIIIMKEFINFIFAKIYIKRLFKQKKNKESTPKVYF